MKTIQKGENRSYPQCCMSDACGKITCPSTCRHLPTLQEFKAWREAGAAVREDPIWCPSFWTATRDAEVGDA